MKIAIEIKDEKFIFDYYFSKHSGSHNEMPMSPKALCWFTDMLKVCNALFDADKSKAEVRK